MGIYRVKVLYFNGSCKQYARFLVTGKNRVEIEQKLQGYFAGRFHGGKLLQLASCEEVKGSVIPI